MALHLAASLGRILVGYTSAVICGVLLGSVAALNCAARETILPILDLMISQPTIAWVPILLPVLGLGDKVVTAAIFLGAVFVICFNTIRGIELVPQELAEAAALDGASSWVALWWVLLPNALPSLLAGLRLGWAYAWRALVGAEMLAAMVRHGLGKMIYEARYWNDVRTMLAGLALLGLCGVVYDKWVIGWIEKRTTRKWF